MKIYNFITFSDDITFKADDDKIAFVCAVTLGNGKAACERLSEADEKPNMVNIPSMLMFESEPVAKMTEFVGGDFKDFVDNNREKIAECFKSFAYSTINDRCLYDEACAAITDPEKLATYKELHADKQRTSMSQWVTYAWKLGDRMLNKLKEE